MSISYKRINGKQTRIANINQCEIQKNYCLKNYLKYKEHDIIFRKISFNFCE